MWEVDVHEGVLQGLVLAEVELQYEGQELALPSWIGREPTIPKVGVVELVAEQGEMSDGG